MFQPRFIRLKNAPYYLGMDKNRFALDVRPHLPSLRIGRTGIAFDRHDLDTWADEFKQQQLSNSSSAAASHRPSAGKEEKKTQRRELDRERYKRKREQIAASRKKPN